MASLNDKTLILQGNIFGGDRAHDQPIDPKRTSVKESQKQGTCVNVYTQYKKAAPGPPGERCPSKARCLYCRPYHHPKEAEFSASENSPRALNQWT
jgi:hypothetical protein